jgi:hypothetical protein
VFGMGTGGTPPLWSPGNTLQLFVTKSTAGPDACAQAPRPAVVLQGQSFPGLRLVRINPSPAIAGSGLTDNMVKPHGKLVLVG